MDFLLQCWWVIIRICNIHSRNPYFSGLSFAINKAIKESAGASLSRNPYFSGLSFAIMGAKNNKFLFVSSQSLF